jgi:hypothetical protein
MYGKLMGNKRDLAAFLPHGCVCLVSRVCLCLCRVRVLSASRVCVTHHPGVCVSVSSRVSRDGRQGLAVQYM